MCVKPITKRFRKHVQLIVITHGSVLDILKPYKKVVL